MYTCKRTAAYWYPCQCAVVCVLQSTAHPLWHQSNIRTPPRSVSLETCAHRTSANSTPTNCLCSASALPCIKNEYTDVLELLLKVKRCPLHRELRLHTEQLVCTAAIPEGRLCKVVHHIIDSERTQSLCFKSQHQHHARASSVKPDGEPLWVLPHHLWAHAQSAPSKATPRVPTPVLFSSGGGSDIFQQCSFLNTLQLFHRASEIIFNRHGTQ